jgi:hypothetical protein
MNWPILILFGMAAISFVVWLTIRNQKDEKEFEQQLNNDIKKDHSDSDDPETDEIV